eukprot:1042434-Rhodomonas_salina.1
MLSGATTAPHVHCDSAPLRPPTRISPTGQPITVSEPHVLDDQSLESNTYTGSRRVACAGYVNAHARQHSSSPDSIDAPLLFLAKRSAPIFPVYALGIVLAALLRMTEDSKLPPWWILGPQVGAALFARVPSMQ